MKKIELVMTDLDETLLSNHALVTDKNQEMIDQLIKDEVIVIPATGRFHPLIPQYFFEHDTIRYLVSANGAQIYDKKEKEFILSHNLDKSIVIDMVKQAVDKATYIIVLHDGDIVLDGVAMKRHKDKDSDFYVNLVKNYETVDDIVRRLETLEGNIQKVDFGFEDLEFRNKLYEKFRKEIRVNAVGSAALNIELTHPNASKGTALEFMANHLNVDLSDTLAIGDNDNDMSMIQTAGIGIAMGNAKDHVKDKADDTTLDVNDDGFYHAIKKHMKY